MSSINDRSKVDRSTNDRCICVLELFLSINPISRLPGCITKVALQFLDFLTATDLIEVVNRDPKICEPAETTSEDPN